MFCKNCGTVINSTTRFCPGCGAKVEQKPDSSVCPACGTPVKTGAKFCENCGATLGGAVLLSSPPAVDDPNRPVCPYCGMQLASMDDHCPECGLKAVTMQEYLDSWVCPECSEVLSKGETCPYCGKKAVPRRSMSAQQQPAPAPAPQPAPMRKPEVGHQQTPRRTSDRMKQQTPRRTSDRLKQQTRPVTPKHFGKRAVAFATACAVFLVTAFGYPGFLKTKDGNDNNTTAHITSNQTYPNDDQNDGDNPLLKDFKSKRVAEGTITRENRSLSDKGVSVTIENGFMGDAETRNVEVNKITETVNYSFDGTEEVPLTVYDVKVEGISTESMLTIELPMDKSAAPMYGAGYIDEESGELIPVINKYDPETGILTIRTTHLTKFCGIPIENENTRKATIHFTSDLEEETEMSDAEREKLLAILNKNTEQEPSVASGWQLFEEVCSIKDKAGMINDVLALGSIGEIVNTGADGASSIIYMGGNYGTTGEIMNTNWGKAGAWSAEVQGFKTPTKIVNYDDQLKSVYPSGVIDKIGTALQVTGWTMALVKIGRSINEEGLRTDKTAAVAYQALISEAVGIFDRMNLINAPTALSVYMIGVSCFGLALDYVYTTALEGRKEVYLKAYNKYYNRPENHRTDDDWIKVLKPFMKPGGGGEEAVMNEIDRYCKEFWEHADKLDIEYLESIMTEDDKIAWGAAGAAGLTQELKDAISSDYKKQLLSKRMPDIFKEITEEAEWQLRESQLRYMNQLHYTLNQIVTLDIESDSNTFGSDGICEYAGCIVRFKDIKNKVADPKDWETVLDSQGKGQIKFTFFAHMFSNVGTEIEIVRIEDGREEVLITDNSEFEDHYWGMSAEYTIKNASYEKASGGLSLEVKETDVSDIFGFSTFESDEERLYSGNVTANVLDNYDIEITIPACASGNFKGDSFYEDEYYSYSMGGFSFVAKAEEDAGYKLEEYDGYSCTAQLNGISVPYSYEHYEKEKLRFSGEGTVKFTGEAKVVYERWENRIYLEMWLPYEQQGTSHFFTTRIGERVEEVHNVNYSGDLYINCSR